MVNAAFQNTHLCDLRRAQEKAKNTRDRAVAVRPTAADFRTIKNGPPSIDPIRTFRVAAKTLTIDLDQCAWRPANHKRRPPRS